MGNRVVITGMGILAANGNTVADFWDSLREGRSGIGPITHFDADDLACKIAGEVKNFRPTDHIDPSLKPHRMGRSTQLAVAAARQAFTDARLETTDLGESLEMPIIIGVCTNSMDVLEQLPRATTPLAALPNAAAAAISYEFGLRAKVVTISNACVSGLEAIATGFREIAGGHADVVMAGGADASLTRYLVESMLKCRRCCTTNDDPEHASRPFDMMRNRGVMAEGAGIVVLENYEHARARGALFSAELIGFASIHDPRDAEEGAGMALTMRAAIDNAGIRAEDVDYISAHGPSDSEMDLVETKAIKDVFGERAYAIPVSSVKGVTGCPMGGGGPHQVIAGALSFRDGILPPTANLVTHDPACDLDYIPRRARLADPRHIVVNGHGIGRSNASLVMKRLVP